MWWHVESTCCKAIPLLSVQQLHWTIYSSALLHIYTGHIFINITITLNNLLFRIFAYYIYTGIYLLIQQLHWTIYSSALLHIYTPVYIYQYNNSIQQFILPHFCIIINISIKWTRKNHSVLNLVFTLTAKFSSILLPNFHN